MRTLLLLTFLLMFVSPGQNTAVSDDGSPVVVLGFKWARSRQVIEKLSSPVVTPAPAMIPADKNFERNRRANDPAGVRDPNADTLDGRSAALEKSVQESRAPKPKPVDGFAYRVKVQNASKKVIEVVFWEYQFKELANPTTVARRQFLCGVNVKPDKEKELQAFSSLGPSDVISVGSLASKSENLFEEKVVINRVEYADGSIWQRKDWNFAEVRSNVARAVGTPWGAEMCRGI
jgi:hypothetical protein